MHLQAPMKNDGDEHDVLYVALQVQLKDDHMEDDEMMTIIIRLAAASSRITILLDKTIFVSFAYLLLFKDSAVNDGRTTVP